MKTAFPEYDLILHAGKWHVYYVVDGGLSDDAISTHNTQGEAMAARNRYQAADKRRSK